MAILLSTILLLAFALLAIIDGFYLHILKYQLFNHKESQIEHYTHTIRAILFPMIVYSLFISQNSLTSFYLGILLVAIDIAVLGIDAFLEKDSRAFMGGLPRWEYILHLFVNGFHFASIALFLSIKLIVTENGIDVVEDISNLKYYKLFYIIAYNLIPGAIILAIIHLVTSLNTTKLYWNNFRSKMTCC